MEAEFEEWLREYALRMYNNEFVFHDYSRQSFFTTHGDDMFEAYKAAKETI